MTNTNGKRVIQLTKEPGNCVCADCKSDEIEYASYNIGVFLCTLCAGVHRSLGAHISQVKHLKLGSWEDSHVRRMEEVGNEVARKKFEELVPMCYRRPTQATPQVLREQWIRAKYERQEFMHASKQKYTSGHKEGYLFKRSKIDDSANLRRFVLSEKDKTLKYYVNNKKNPKAEIRVLELNVSFAPEKIKLPTSLQLSFLHKGSTRHIFVFHDDPKVIVEWYMAIRSVKLTLLLVAYPTMSDTELSDSLTQDFLKEGYLLKTGSRPTDGFKKRWFTLDGRKLMYHEHPLDPYPKGEIFLGCHNDGFSVGKGAGPNSNFKVRGQGFTFYLETPSRSFWFSSERADDREEWIGLLDSILHIPTSPQDTYCRSTLKTSRKRYIHF